MKVDITITDGLTLNIGNYRSARPEVSLTVTGVELDKYDETYQALSALLQKMLHVEAAKLITSAEGIESQGIKFPKMLADAGDALEEEINGYINKLKELSA